MNREKNEPARNCNSHVHWSRRAEVACGLRRMTIATGAQTRGVRCGTSSSSCSGRAHVGARRLSSLSRRHRLRRAVSASVASLLISVVPPAVSVVPRAVSVAPFAVSVAPSSSLSRRSSSPSRRQSAWTVRKRGRALKDEPAATRRRRWGRHSLTAEVVIIYTPVRIMGVSG